MVSEIQLTENNNVSSEGSKDSSFSNSFLYHFIQLPYDGLKQLADRSVGKPILPELDLAKAPNHQEFATGAWFQNVAASTLASALQFAGAFRLIGIGSAAKFEQSIKYGVNLSEGLSSPFLPHLKKSAYTGLVVGGVFNPVDNNLTDGQFVIARFKNAGLSALNFMAITTGAVAMKSSGSGILSNDILAGSLPAAAVGFISPDLHELVHNGKTLSGWSGNFESAAAYALGGALASGINMGYEAINPTSGIKGIRTYKQVKELADSTVMPGYPERYAYDPHYEAPRKSGHLLHRDPKELSREDGAARAMRAILDTFPDYPLARRKEMMTGFQAWLEGNKYYSRPEPNPTVVFLGSVRGGPQDFDYQFMRYLGGLAAKYKLDVATGGAPGVGMEAPNMGAYQGGYLKPDGSVGRVHSIGVTIQIPREKVTKPDEILKLGLAPEGKALTHAPGNGYANIIIDHPIFDTRLFQLLGFADMVVIAPRAGVGTTQERTTVLTEVQSHLASQIPVYAVNSAVNRGFSKYLNLMLKEQTINPSDARLEKIIADPRQIEAAFAKLSSRRDTAQMPKEQAGQGGIAGLERLLEGWTFTK